VRQALGAVTVNAAVFMRADRPVRDRELAAFHRAVLAAESRLATATAAELAERLSSSITVPSEEFEGRPRPVVASISTTVPSPSLRCGRRSR